MSPGRLVAAAVAIVIGMSCSGPEPFEPIEAPGVFVLEGTVRDGMFCWGIVTDSAAYQANGLDERYARDGLRVKANVRFADVQGSVCQIGPIVDVLSAARQ